MKQVTFSGILLVCLVCLLERRAISGTITLFVPATGTGVATTDSLDSGQTYLVTSSGTFDYTYGMWHDATWYRSGNTPTYTIGGLWMNGSKPIWEGTTNGTAFAAFTFSPSHEYRMLFTGTGGPASFFIYDSQYWDNAGGLTVSLTAVPEIGLGAAGSVTGLLIAALSLFERRVGR